MPYGRLADPDCTIGTDPRADPRMVKALAAFGIDGRLPEAPLTVDAPLAQRVEFSNFAEQGTGAVLKMFGEQAPAAAGVTTSTTTITGTDGNEITLFISRPTDADGPLPGLVHLHGGGMAICSAADIQYVRLRENLAAAGLVVVGVEFRNSGGALGPPSARTRSRPVWATAPRPCGGPRRTRTSSGSATSSCRGSPAAGT
ncbi:hypothetical protein MPHO_47370 [Mycolicibacterium phocaicum]|nr:hypothetical protein MPHO_47370 [Mycolicibacterium phocaicum]